MFVFQRWYELVGSRGVISLIAFLVVIALYLWVRLNRTDE